MITVILVILTFILGALFGFFTIALMVAASEISKRDKKNDER